MAGRFASLSTWRGSILVEADQIQAMAEASSAPQDNAWRKAVAGHLETARHSALRHRGLGRLVASWSGADVERAWRELHAAQQATMMVLSGSELLALAPSLSAKLKIYPPPPEAGKKYAEWLDAATPTTASGAQFREIRSAIDTESDQHFASIRRFRNILFAAATLLTIFLAGATLANQRADFLPLCAKCITAAANASGGTATTLCPEPANASPSNGSGTCPLLIQILLVGAAGGLFSAIVSLRRLNIQKGPYAVPIAQAILKLPMGAFTALIGTVLLQTKAIDGLQPQQTPDLFLYVFLFGVAQEAITRFVDKKADSVVAPPGDGDPPKANENGVTNPEPSTKPVTTAVAGSAGDIATEKPEES